MRYYAYSGDHPEDLWEDISDDFLYLAETEGITEVGDWQALDVTDAPQGRTVEMQNVIFLYDVPKSQTFLRPLGANQPWAEDHFQERVGGEPLNPGEQYKNWPYYKGNVDKHRKCGDCGQAYDRHLPGGDLHNECTFKSSEAKFSHTYMERFWPRQVGPSLAAWRQVNDGNNYGIRYRYGDLNDLVGLLARSPNTRQAYLPVWFPEDTGAVHGERVPCTLGYHFLLRENRLHITYFIRSCDYLRHFRDDVYLAARLCQWVLDRLRSGEILQSEGSNENDDWNSVVPGTLTMHICSFHVFEGDLPMMRRKLRG